NLSYPRFFCLGLDYRELVPIRVLEVRRCPPCLFLRLSVSSNLEVHSSSLESLVVSLTVVGGERPMDASGSSFRWQVRLDLELALDEDEFEVLPFWSDCEPAGLSLLLVVCSFLEAEDFGVELERLL